MQALKKEVIIPDNHHLVIDFDIPESVPAGKTEVMVIINDLPASTPKPESSKKAAEWLSRISKEFNRIVSENKKTDNCHTSAEQIERFEAFKMRRGE